MKTPRTPSTALTTPKPSGPRGRAALEALRPAMEALAPEALHPINVDIPHAVARALGVGPTLRSLRPRIAAECPAVDLGALDALEARALAVEYAHAVYVTALSPLPVLTEVAAEAAVARARLLSLAETLVAWNLLDPRSLDRLHSGAGYHHTAGDLIALTALLRVDATVLDGRTPATSAQLDAWHLLGERLLRLVGVRDEQPARAAEAHADRQRAFTLFDLAYEEGRRAVAFLRWNAGDADELMPSIRSRGGGGAPRREEQAPVAPKPADPTDPKSAPVEPKQLPPAASP